MAHRPHPEDRGVTESRDLTREVVDELRSRRLTIGVAESLTGGLLIAELVRIPGASEVVRGGVVAYATDLKHRLLGVDADLLARRGPVDPDVAAQMASGARDRLGPGQESCAVGVSTTGVAGPGPQDGHPAGTVFVGLSHGETASAQALLLAGDRQSIREQTVRAAIAMLHAQLLDGDAL
jgi:nicotinamide-nucleotide amidase